MEVEKYQKQILGCLKKQDTFHLERYLSKTKYLRADDPLTYLAKTFKLEFE